MPVDYLLKRSGQLLLIIFLAVTINFAVPRMIPGDPIEAALSTQLAIAGAEGADIQAVVESYRARFGLDQPITTQYVNYWEDIVRGDLGVSLVSFPDPVVSKIAGALPWTLGLLTTSTLIAFVVGSLLGAVLAWPKAPRGLKAVVPPLMLIASVPFFLLAIVLIFLFAVVWNLFPAAGGFSSTAVLRMDMATTLDILHHAFLPAVAIVLGGVGFWALGMRGMMVSVLNEDYITFAEAKGLSPKRIFFWYGIRNALLPQMTAIGLALGFVLSGSVLVEAIFAYPGLGHQLFLAIVGKDFFVIQGIVLLLIISLGVALFVVDLIYPFVDPRVRYQRK
jgi:peptide/nickel transport system permease protein